MYTISKDKGLLDLDVICKYLSKESYWAQGRTREVIEKSIQNSICYGIYSNDQQIGFARVITDYAVFAWLLDVFVLPDYQGKGAGKKLMTSIMEDVDLAIIKRWRLSTADAHGLYKQYGFTALEKPEYMMEK
ncbi:GNAT family N-acetyltransferase [Carboxylicivirga linearis]|uniref:GNAT family N-acetyltransferase n=1 Tax=Carboxylicivirga linearis TaxID=1628157 RepID=A0ABS5JRU1_9BACT|nr:GNAT family N-acetyltransferase [Carboxylicivirga linearis]MBS2097608.1 GNAT family N-acetyltransferase [Carboxylicivirga linearis]